MTNRLRLNFSIPDDKGRAEFIQKYLKENFPKNNLTADEKETIANYLLYGREDDGKNIVQKKLVEIKTKNKTWDRKDEESLTALAEKPSFNENSIQTTIPKIQKEVFSRSKALQNIPEELKDQLQSLFKKIDNTELLINYYDLDHELRKTQPRDLLLNRIPDSEKEILKEKAKKLSYYNYLKKRHDLVELRKEQYSFKNSYSRLVQKDFLHFQRPEDLYPTFDFEIPIFPLGLLNPELPISKEIFKPLTELPLNQAEESLKTISKYIWFKDEEKKKQNENSLYFSFSNPDHLYELFLQFHSISDSKPLEPVKSLEETSSLLLKTLDFYIRETNLSPIHSKILQLKIQKKKNQEIVQIINEQFQKKYTENYISTIFKQKILREIASTADFHLEILQNIFFPENFKKCTSCGRTLLISSHNFVRRARSKDGFSNRCKSCDKEKRNS